MERSRIRILEALTIGHVGGTETMVLQLLENLDPTLFACDISVLDGPGPIVERAARIGIPVHDLGGRRGYAGAAYRLRQLMTVRQYDIVHLYGFRMTVLGRLVAHSVRPRPIVVGGIRGLRVAEVGEKPGVRGAAALALEWLLNPLMDAFIANSRGSVDFLSRHGLPRDRFVVIPNGIDASYWFRSNSAIERDGGIICVANFKPGKRQCDLIEAIALLANRGLRVRCVFVGDGVTRPAAENLVRERRLVDSIKFLGRREPAEIRALLHQSRIFVLASLWEGMPVSVMEAMAAGLPVVGTDVPGISELVVNGVTGYLVALRNPSALAERIGELLKDGKLRSEMGTAGRERILREFALERMVRRHEEVYTTLIRRKAGGHQLLPLATG